jgi:hypothetical protein
MLIVALEVLLALCTLSVLTSLKERRICVIVHSKDIILLRSVIIIFLFLVLPSSTYLLTVGVEGFFNSILSHSDTHHSR